MESEEKWEEIEEPTLKQKVMKILFPSKKILTKKVRKIKQKEVVDAPKLNENIPKSTTTNQESQLTPPSIEDEWKQSKIKVRERASTSNVDKSIPAPMVLKRLIATFLIITYGSGIIFVAKGEAITTLLMLSSLIILIDYLIITSPNKQEKWNE